MVTAPTNLAVQEIAEIVLKEIDFDAREVLFLQSITNESEPHPLEVRRWELCRVPEVLQAFHSNNIEEARTAFVMRYISKRIVHDGNAYKEGEALKTLIEIRCPKLMCGTVPIIRMLLQVWEQYFNEDLFKYLVIDEGDLIPEMFLFGLIANLPNLQQVLISGDQYQLPPYTGALSDNVICMGHEGAIQNLMVNHRLKRACLMRNFRSHPVLVETLSAAAYNHQLVPALSERDRMMWKLLGFPVKVADIPILLLHTSGREYLTLERIWSNDLHNEVAVKMRQYILERLPEANITILCYYSASVKRIAA